MSDVGLDLSADIVLCLLDVIFLPLVAGKVRRDPGLDDHPFDPVIGPLGWSGTEATLGGGGDVGECTDSTECNVRGNLP